MLSEDVTSETIGVDIEDVIRMNASAMAVQTFLGTKDEKETITNLCRTIDAGIKYGIPTLAVVALSLIHILIIAGEHIKKVQTDDVEEVLKEAAEGAVEGMKATENYVAKFGRAKSYGEQTLGYPDAGAVGVMYLFRGMYEGYRI